MPEQILAHTERVCHVCASWFFFFPLLNNPCFLNEQASLSCGTHPVHAPISLKGKDKKNSESVHSTKKRTLKTRRF
uniref:Uncharacterized protein n=1 Tax=Anguilla anguilla TaxID=7936 RepID=A0A0E9WXK3_ANGAN